MIRIEHNVETGEILEIPLTKEEIEDINYRQKLAEPKIAELKKERLKNQQLKEQLLEKLGITEEEAKLLLS